MQTFNWEDYSNEIFIGNAEATQYKSNQTAKRNFAAQARWYEKNKAAILARSKEMNEKAGKKLRVNTKCANVG